jgi:hypothetical protein
MNEFYETPTEDTCGVKVNRVGEIADASNALRKEYNQGGWWTWEFRIGG